MSSPEHAQYQEQLIGALRRLSHDPDLRRRIHHNAHAIAILYTLDLQPAHLIIAPCYATFPRGGCPWQPVAIFRAILLAHLIERPKFAQLSAELRGCPVLRAIAGFSTDEQDSHDQPAPGTSTFYDFCSRILDGPRSALLPKQERLSKLQSRRANSPRRPQQRRDKKVEKADKKGVTKSTKRISERLRLQLLDARESENASDLNTRLGHILLSCAVIESAQRGLLGDIGALDLSGDGSPLPTAAFGKGQRCCDCPRQIRCDCPRLFSDPDACIGYDSYRERFFFGHHFYEVGVYQNGHDLPIHVRIDPGNETDHTASMKAVDWLAKAFRDTYPGFSGTTFIADSGHDGCPVYRFAQSWSLDTVIPLGNKVPATHPSRNEISLSKRGIPLCQASIEMTPWGSAGPDKRRIFICPLRAKKIAVCPLAPESQPDWHCRPELKYGPSVSVASQDDPRLFPRIARNSRRYGKLYRQRSGTERSNNAKKNGYHVSLCRHRRSHLWHIRLVTAAILQHASVWVSRHDALAFIADILGEQEVAA